MIVFVTIQIKNVILIVALGLFVSAFVFYHSAITTQEMIDAKYYDFYYYAQNQRYFYRYDVLSFFLIGIYFLKYFQLISSVNYIFISLKKTAFEYIALICTVAVLFVGLSILTAFVYGSYIYEYRSFETSITTNIKIFIFQEDTFITIEFLKYFRAFSIIVLIIFIFLIRFFLLNLFYPILLEYYRLEYDKVEFSKEFNMQTEDNPNYTAYQSK